MLKMLFSKESISEIEIAEFEQFIDYKLPDDYKTFLLKYNGGRPAHDVFDFYLYKEDASSVNMLFSLGKEKFFNLYSFYINYKQRIPLGFIPIANDPGGNLILMNLIDAKNGIYFWDHEFEADEALNEIPSMSNMCLIKPSFNEFIDSLYE